MEIPSWFIAGKAAIWLLLPIAWGIFELWRHNKMMARDRERHGRERPTTRRG